MTRTLLLAPLAAMLLASTAAHAQAAPAHPRPAHRSAELAQREIATVHVADAYAALHALRPTWLVPLAPPETVFDLAPPQVWVNGRYEGGADVLHRYRPERVRQAHYYAPREARARFGVRGEHGVISLSIV